MDLDKKNYELAKELRHQLHEHPELSYQETWTKKHLIEFIKKHTKLEVVDRGLWFYAIYRAGQGKENIAFRADFDALPMDEYLDIPHGSKIKGMSHKCGHDGHSAALAGFALEVDQKGADKNVFFLFQHAEETGQGAIECAVFIKENNIDEIYTFHNNSGYPFKSVVVKNGLACFASKGMEIKMEGIPSHASQPEKGRNPSFAIANIINSIPELTSSDNNQGLVLCTIVQVDIGERAFGINASKGNLLLTIRAYYEKEMDDLQNKIEVIARNQAQEYGLKVDFMYYDVFPETVNHDENVEKVRKVALERGHALYEQEEAQRGSEDFGYYTKETKGAYFLLGNGEDYPSVHTNEYDFRDELIAVANDMFLGLLE